MEFHYENKALPLHLRVDRGTETGKMATIQVFLADKLKCFEDPTDAVIFGPSTTNKIERWWRDLHERLEKYFKVQLQSLLNSGNYDPQNLQDRQILAYVYIPIIQRELDIFTTQWNTHRIRTQNKLQLPSGVPQHMFQFPEKYGGENKGSPLQNELIEEVAVLSGVLETQLDDHPFVEDNLKTRCKQFLPDPEVVVSSKEAMDAFLFLKHKLNS